MVTGSGKPNAEVVAIRAGGSAPGSAPGGRGSEVGQWAAKRQLYVDNLKLWGGWYWSALVFAAGESTLSVFGPVWLLGVAQQRLNRSFRWARLVISRSSYGAFMLQGPVLIALAIALRPLPLPAEVKALIVAAGGVVGSFALSWLLVSRVPGVRRIL